MCPGGGSSPSVAQQWFFSIKLHSLSCCSQYLSPSLVDLKDARCKSLNDLCMETHLGCYRCRFFSPLAASSLAFEVHR